MVEAKVLIVAPSRERASLLAARLRREGYTVCGAHASLAEAAAAAAGEAPDLLLVDRAAAPDTAELRRLRREFVFPMLVVEADGGLADGEPDLLPEAPPEHGSRAAAVGWHYQSLLEMLPDAVMVQTEDFLIPVNAAAEALLGRAGPQWPMEEVWNRMVHASDRDALRARWREVQLGGAAAATLTVGFWRPDGDLRETETRSQAIAYQGRPALLMVVRDLTEARRAEARSREAQAAPRAALLREVHDRIRNNLQAVGGMLKRELGAHPGLQEPLRIAMSQVQSIALAHGLAGREGEGASRLTDLLLGICLEVESVLERRIALPPLAPIRRVLLSSAEAVPMALVLNDLFYRAARQAPPAQDGIAARLSFMVQGEELELAIETAESAETDAGVATGELLLEALMPAQGALLSRRRLPAGGLARVLRLAPPVIAWVKTRKEGNRD